jgi:drug/metabolite transporter (DMT)-like permease
MVIGFLAAFIFVLLLAISIFCFGYASKEADPSSLLCLATISSFILVFLLLVTVEKLPIQEVFSKPTVHNWFWLSTSAISGHIGGNYFSYLNLKTAGEKINSLLAPAITAFAVIAGYFVFHDRLDTVQWIGILITLIAVLSFLVYNVRSRWEGKNSKLGALSGMATILLMSYAIIGAVKGANGISIYHAVWVQFTVATIIITPFLLRKVMKVQVKNRDRFLLAIIGGVISENILAGYLWYYASFKIGVSIFQTIIATLPLVVYAIDVYLVKKSRPSNLIIIASILALAGIGLVMLT